MRFFGNQMLLHEDKDVYRFDPLADERWGQLLEADPSASIFHTTGWLQALKHTYGYEPIGFTTSKPKERLSNGIIFCRVKSWITGSRIVSLPFSDHCEPLLDSAESFEALLVGIQAEAQRMRWKYVELRPLVRPAPIEGNVMFPKAEEFYFHRLDLKNDADSVFRRFHKSCVQRKIRRAEKENLVYERGRSETLLERFYSLLVLTRRRHQLPPQPLKWFRHLANCLGDRLTIHLVSKGETPVASIVTLTYRSSLVYKYGCSNDRFHNLGGMPFLFWTAIQEAKEHGIRELDLGRSDLENSGLVQFKDHLGAACSKLTYYRYPAVPASSQLHNWGSRAVRYLFSQAPDSLLVPAGKLLYKHLG